MIAHMNDVAMNYPTALEHARADARCGRSWQCACAACRAAKGVPRVRVRIALCNLDMRRTLAGTCRHCAGALPCHSEFGDSEPGKRHTKRSLKAARKERAETAARTQETPWLA